MNDFELYSRVPSFDEMEIIMKNRYLHDNFDPISIEEAQKEAIKLRLEEQGVRIFPNQKVEAGCIVEYEKIGFFERYIKPLFK